MPEILSEPRQLADYRLIQRLSETRHSTTWLAEQVSVSRPVLLDEFTGDDPSAQAEFLADVRAKAAIDHPLIGSVYEAVAEPSLCFSAYELLPGETLSTRIGQDTTLPPSHLIRLLHRISEANLYYESHNHSTTPLTLEAIHVNEHDVVRLCNLATAAPRSPEDSERDITFLGEALVPLVATEKPATNRMLTLLGWMRGKEIPRPLTWLEIINLCEQIDQQLSGPLPDPSPTLPGKAPISKRPVALLAALTGIALLAILFLTLKTRPITPRTTEKIPLPPPISIADGTSSFLISSHETTIGEYAAFLETLEILAKDGREHTFDHPEQPAEKTTHLPDDWEALLSAAQSSGTWNGQSVTLESPVMGVDWWDATAYASWKQGRLPTQEEWLAALKQGTENPKKLPASLWVPVNPANPDRTTNGLLSMAGSLAEWTRLPTTNPSNPLGEKLWVLIGGSHANPGSNALTREWVENRSLRRPDLGFRIVWDEK